MRRAGGCLGLCLIILVTLARTSDGQEATKQGHPAKKVLVELFSSQNDSLAPQASELLIKLEKLGGGADRVVALNFHVDSGEATWNDVFAQPFALSRRNDYRKSWNDRVLSPAPFFVIDGNEVVAGPTRNSLVEAIGRAECRNSGLQLSLRTSTEGSQTFLHARMVDDTLPTVTRQLRVSVAFAQDYTSTKVLAGDNAGRRLYEHHVVHQFREKPLLVQGKAPVEVSFPIEPIRALEPGRFHYVVIVQDRVSGLVDRVDSIAAPIESKMPDLVLKKHRRKSPLNVDLGILPGLGLSGGDLPSCPDCGTPYSSQYLALFPPGFHPRNRNSTSNVPPPEC